MSRVAALWEEWDLEDFFGDALGSSASSAGGSTAAVTYPTTDLAFRVQIALTPDFSHGRWWEWGWADITEFVRYDPGITWTSGRRDESTSVAAGSGSIRLENSDGRFSRRNPYGAYYPFLTKNTPIWVQADAGTGYVTLLQHFVNEWPSRWDQSQRDAKVPIATAGILRRLAQGSVFKSPLRQTILGGTPIGYWPCEDDEGATSVASGLSSGPPLAGSATPHFTTDTGIVGSTGALDLVATTSSMTAVIPRQAAASFQVEFVGLSTVVGTVVMGIVVSGSLSVPMGFVAALCDGEPHHVAYQFTQNGADVDRVKYHDGVFYDSATFTGATIAADIRTGTAGVDFSAETGQILFSHLTVYDSADMEIPVSRAGAADGYDGEQAHARVARICAAESIPYTITCGTSVTMGPQPIGVTALDVLRECEAADLGSLYEVGFGLGYQGNRERDNAPVAMILDMDLGHVAATPEPTDDDQGLVNKFTASRSGGSEATYEQTTGPMGTGSGGPGLYDSSATVNVEPDNQLLAAASARVVRGTVDEDRWPVIPVQFTKPSTSAALLPTWLTMQPFGARINITHPPTQMAPDTIDAFIDGYTQRVTPIEWDVTLNTSPASPHRVFVLAGPDDDTNPLLGYMIPTTCVLAEDLDTTETGVDITTTPLWSTTAADWTPGAVVTCEGEDMTVTAVSGGSNPQTLTVTRSTNTVVKTHPSGATVAFKSPGFLGL